jgi:hypothetical protein
MVAGDENRRTGKERCLVSLLPFQGLTINKTSWAGSLPKPTTGHWRRVARLEWRFSELSKKQIDHGTVSTFTRMDCGRVRFTCQADDQSEVKSVSPIIVIRFL